MSYILDALRKSEEQRHAQKTSQFKPASHHAEPTGAGRTIVIAAILLVALLTGWFIAQLQYRDETVQQLQPAPAKLSQQSVAVTEQKINPAEQIQPAESKIQIQPNQTMPPATSQNADDGIADETVLSREQLPHAILQSLPVLAIDGHIYDINPVARLVIINGSSRKEGQHISAELQLEEITSDGVILKTQGIRFRLGVFD